MTIPLPDAIPLMNPSPASRPGSGAPRPSRVSSPTAEHETPANRFAHPWVLIAVPHPAMRRLILALLDREQGCWNACIHPATLGTALRDLDPDLAIVDGVDFPRCCVALPTGYPRSQVVVIGQEPDARARAAALRLGAGGWVARDEIAEQLTAEMRIVLGRRTESGPVRS